MAKSERPRNSENPKASRRPSAKPGQETKEPDFGPDWEAYCATPVPEDIRRVSMEVETKVHAASMIRIGADGYLTVDGEKADEHVRALSAYCVNERNADELRAGIRRMVMDLLAAYIQKEVDAQKEEIMGRLMSEHPGALEGTVSVSGQRFLTVATIKDGNGGGRSFHITKTDGIRGVNARDSVVILPGKKSGGTQDGPLPEASFICSVPDYARKAADAFVARKGQ